MCLLPILVLFIILLQEKCFFYITMCATIVLMLLGLENALITQRQTALDNGWVIITKCLPLHKRVPCGGWDRRLRILAFIYQSSQLKNVKKWAKFELPISLRQLNRVFLYDHGLRSLFTACQSENKNVTTRIHKFCKMIILINDLMLTNRWLNVELTTLNRHSINDDSTSTLYASGCFPCYCLRPWA